MRTRPKYLIAALCGMMILVACAAGCTSSNTSPSPSAQAASGAGSASVSENASTTAQKSSREAVDLSVHYVGSPQSIGPLNATPGDGYKWVVYNVTIKDINVTNYLVMDSNFMLNLSNGNLSLPHYIVNYTEALGANNRTLANMYTIQPGETASGTMVFAVPTNVSPKTITYRNAYMHGTVYGEDVRTFDASVR